MKNKMILGLLLGISMWGLTANAAQIAMTCDRECLRGKVTQLLYAFPEPRREQTTRSRDAEGDRRRRRGSRSQKSVWSGR